MMMEKEKAEFDLKLQKGRYASVVKSQEFYRDVIGTLEKADIHMKKTIAEATDLLNRVVQVDPEIEGKTKALTLKIVEETMEFDLAENHA